MNGCINRLFTDKGYAIGWGIISFFIIAISVVVVAITFSIGFLNATSKTSDYPSNVITVDGIGEVNASPDVATFSFTIRETADTTDEAGTKVNEKMETVSEYLEDFGVEEVDVKTTGYNIYPKYEWKQETCLFDAPCPPGKNELVGYEASQSVSVKIREIDDAGEALSGIGALNVSNISSLQFTIDDDASLKEEAQKLAIADAKSRAKRLTKELGVSLKGVVSFYENSGGYPEPYYMETRAMSVDSEAAFNKAAVLPTGENTVTSRVSITYEIK